MEVGDGQGIWREVGREDELNNGHNTDSPELSKFGSDIRENICTTAQ